MKRLRRFKEITLQDRIVAWAKEVRAQAARLPLVQIEMSC
jgi:hypothetical protein